MWSYRVFQDPMYWDLSNGHIKGAINWAVAFDLRSTDPQMQKVVTVAFDSPRAAPNGENQGGAVIISRITGRDSYEVIK